MASSTPPDNVESSGIQSVIVCYPHFLSSKSMAGAHRTRRLGKGISPLFTHLPKYSSPQDFVPPDASSRAMGSGRFWLGGR